MESIFAQRKVPKSSKDPDVIHNPDMEPHTCSVYTYVRVTSEPVPAQNVNTDFTAQPIGNSTHSYRSTTGWYAKNLPEHAHNVHRPRPAIYYQQTQWDFVRREGVLPSWNRSAKLLHMHTHTHACQGLYRETVKRFPPPHCLCIHTLACMHIHASWAILIMPVGCD